MLEVKNKADISPVHQSKYRQYMMDPRIRHLYMEIAHLESSSMSPVIQTEAGPVERTEDSVKLQVNVIRQKISDIIEKQYPEIARPLPEEK